MVQAYQNRIIKHHNYHVEFCCHELRISCALNSASSGGNERQDFLSEIEMMKKVAEGQNPHVVSLLGCVTIKEPLMLITEFVKYGDLLKYLRTNRRMVYFANRFCMSLPKFIHYSALEAIQKTMKMMTLTLSWGM